jgi:hypothetical protein
MAMQGLDALGIEKAILNQWPDIKS